MVGNNMYILTNHDLNEAVEADVVVVCVEEDVGEEAPNLSAPVRVIGEEGTDTFHDS